MKIIELAPVRIPTMFYDQVEARISSLFRDNLYIPLTQSIGMDVVFNSYSDSAVERAIRDGKLRFYRGEFTGRFNAAISRELRSLGATWDRKTESFRILESKIPMHIRTEIRVSALKLSKMIDKLQSRLGEFGDLSDYLKIDEIFDSALLNADKQINKTFKNITVTPELASEERAVIAAGYTQNLRLYIKDWTDKETKKLRAQVEARVIKGLRYEDLTRIIESSYGVSRSKAKFLARQETRIMMSKFQEGRYISAGSTEYTWCCVHGSPLHPVRPMHKKLDRTVQKWKTPPVVNEKGERKNPGCDYGCRCFAKPMVRF